MAKSFLIDKFLVIDDTKLGALFVFKFKERLTETLYVIDPCCPEHGVEQGVGSIIIDISVLKSKPTDQQPYALVFLDWKTAREHLESVTGTTDGEDIAEVVVPSPILH